MSNKSIVLIFIILVISLAIIGFYFASNSTPLPFNTNQNTPATELNIDNALTEQNQVTTSYASFEGNEFLQKYPELKNIISSTDSEQLTTKLELFLSKLPSSDIKETATFIANSKLSSELYGIANKTLLKHWADISALDALSFSKTAYTNPFRASAITYVLEAGCGQAKVINDCLSQLGDPIEFEQHIISISNRFSNNGGFAQSLLWANALNDEEQRLEFVQQQGQKWIAKDPEQAFLWSAKQDAFLTVADQAIEALVETDAWLAYNLVTQTADTHSEKRSRLYEAIVNKLINDGDFLTLASILESSSQHEVVAKLARKWVEVDPEAALVWALNYEDFHSLSLRAIDKLTETDYQKAFELSLSVPDHRNGLRKNMFNSIFSELAQNDDFGSIQTLLKRLPRSENIEDYYPTFIDQWSWADPQSAANAVLLLPQSEQQTQQLNKTFQTWSEKDPQAALSKLNTLSNNTVKENVTSGILQGWGISNIEEAITWTTSQSSSESLDNSITQASLRLVKINEDKSVARKLANTINNQGLRSSTLEAIESHVFSDLDEF